MKNKWYLTIGAISVALMVALFPLIDSQKNTFTFGVAAVPPTNGAELAPGLTPIIIQYTTDHNTINYIYPTASGQSYEMPYNAYLMHIVIWFYVSSSFGPTQQDYFDNLRLTFTISYTSNSTIWLTATSTQNGNPNELFILSTSTYGYVGFSWNLPNYNGTAGNYNGTRFPDVNVNYRLTMSLYGYY